MSVLVTNLGAGPIPAIAPPVPAAKEATFSDDNYAKDLIGQNQAQAAAAEGAKFYSEAAQTRAMALRTAAPVVKGAAASARRLIEVACGHGNQYKLCVDGSWLPSGGRECVTGCMDPGIFHSSRRMTTLIVGAGVLAVGGLVTWMLLKPTRGLRPAMAGLHGRRRRRGRR